jgi:hypothetical protein
VLLNILLKHNINNFPILEQVTKAQRECVALSLASALDGVGGYRHAPAALPPGKNRYPLYRSLGRLQGQTGRLQKLAQSLYRLSYPGRRIYIYIYIYTHIHTYIHTAVNLNAILLITVVRLPENLD